MEALPSPGLLSAQDPREQGAHALGAPRMQRLLSLADGEDFTGGLIRVLKILVSQIGCFVFLMYS